MLHLVTAADGAELHYTNANNETRTETADEARTQDSKTKAVWVGHPRLFVFGNREQKDGKTAPLGFEAKLQVGPLYISL